MIDLSRNGYTHEEVVDMLHMKHGSRKVRFRYFLLDKDENEKEEISHLIESGSIEQSAFSAIKRTAKFKLKDNSIIDWHTDRIQIYIEFRMADGGWIEFALGVFLIASPTKKEEGQSVYREVEAYDKLLITKEDKVSDRYTIRKKTNYRQAMIEILDSAGIDKYNVEESDKLLPNDKEYEPGTEKLSILNDLASDLNYTPFWVDEHGFYTSNRYRSPQEQSSDYTYSIDELSVTEIGMEEELDTFDIPNVFTIVVSNPDTEETFVSTVENRNLSHPRSIPNLGRRVVRFEEKEDIADQESLDAYVERLAFESSQIYGRVRFDTAIMPFHSYSNVLRITNDKLGVNDKYAEVNWSMPLEPGATMTHEVRKVVSLI